MLDPYVSIARLPLVPPPRTKLTFETFPDFWGPASNFGIPVAAVMDVQKDPDMYARSNSYSCPRQDPISFLLNLLQYIWAHDRCSRFVLWNIHALRSCCHTEKPSAICMPFHQLWRPEYSGLSLFAVLEVSRDLLVVVRADNSAASNDAVGKIIYGSGATSAALEILERPYSGCRVTRG